MSGFRETERESGSLRPGSGDDRDVHGAEDRSRDRRPLRFVTVLAETATWVYLVELAVGAGCVVAAFGAFRASLTLIAVVLFVAAAAAIVHAIVALAS